MVKASLEKVLLLLSAIFLFFSWLLPIHYYPWPAFYQDFLAFFSLLLAFVFVLMHGVVLNRGFSLLLLVVLVPVAQYFFGLISFSGDAVMASLYLLGLWGALVVGFSVARGGIYKYNLVYGFAILLILGAVLSTWISFRQWLGLSGSIWVADLPPGGRPFANLGQPNNFATLVCMGIAAVLLFYEKRLLGGFSAGVVTVFLIFGVALSQSRTPWAIGFILGVYWLMFYRRFDARLKPLILLTWLLLFVVITFTLPIVGQWLSLQLIDPIARAGAMHRLDLWAQLIFALIEAPWWGYGWNQVSMAQFEVSLDYPVPIMTEHSHNIFLDLMLWNGPLLGGGIVFIVSVWLFKTVLEVRSKEGVFVIVASGMVLVHGLLEFPLEYAFFLIPVGYMLGWACGERVVRGEILPSRTGVFLCFFAASMLLCIWYEYKKIESDYRLMRFESARVGDLRAESAAPEAYIMSQVREFIRLARTTPYEGMTESELVWMGKVVQRYPFSWAVLRYSLALQANGRLEEAASMLELIQALHGERHHAEAVDYVRYWQEENLPCSKRYLVVVDGCT